MNVKQIWLAITNPPSDKTLAAKELMNARRSYLEHRTHCDYYNALCAFETQRIKRLESYLLAAPKDSEFKR